MYQALYRKWRPMVFADVVGQRHVTDTLKNQIASGRLSHAYLFTGTRGTGKTTCAKLLAKAANCQSPNGGEPCNRCPSCIGINEGSITDVIEIDAASNSGVDNIRAIREQTIYSPAETRLRVYIIDECHMLSGGAFNALLKTLEEPPPHVLFILATTELHKVPATILSRCQRFTFKRIQPGDIATRLHEIASAENIPLAEDAAKLIARLSDGALRDAISILDQCAAASDSAIGTDEVLATLGLAGENDTMRLASAVAEHDTRRALELLGDVYYGGKELSSFLSELSTLFRDILIYKTTGDSSLITGGYSPSSFDEITLTPDRLIYMLSVVQDTLTRLQRSQNRRTDCELCIIKLCSSPTQAVSQEQDPVSHIRATAKPSVPRSTEAAPPADEDDLPPWDTAAPVPKGAPQRSAGKNSSQLKATPPLDNASTSSALNATDNSQVPAGWWSQVLQEVRSHISFSYYPHLVSMRTPPVEGNRLVLLADSDFVKKLLGRRDVLDAVSSAASKVLGHEVTAEITLVSEYRAKEPHGQEAAKNDTKTDDGLERLIELSKKFDNIIIE